MLGADAMPSSHNTALEQTIIPISALAKWPVTSKFAHVHNRSTQKDCIFQLEDDGRNGVCEDMSVTVRGNSFEDAKRKMESALQAHIEGVLRMARRKKIA